MRPTRRSPAMLRRPPSRDRGRSQRARRAALRAGGGIPDRAGSALRRRARPAAERADDPAASRGDGHLLARRLADEGHRRAAHDRAAVGARPHAVGRRAKTSALQPTWVAFFEFTDWGTGRTGTATVSIMLNVAEIYARLSPSRFGQLLRAGHLRRRRPALDHPVRRAADGPCPRALDHRVGARAVRRHRACAAGRLLAPDCRDGEGPAGRAGGFVQQHDGSTSRRCWPKWRRRAARGGDADRPAHPDVAAAAEPAGRIPGRVAHGVLSNRRARSAAITTTSCRSTGNRLGLLIADVAGKGTSAALYMAELKGLMLSLSQIHRSPRELLIAANRIIAAAPRQPQLHHDDLRRARSRRRGR